MNTLKQGTTQGTTQGVPQGVPQARLAHHWDEPEHIELSTISYLSIVKVTRGHVAYTKRARKVASGVYKGCLKVRAKDLPCILKEVWGKGEQERILNTYDTDDMVHNMTLDTIEGTL